MVEKSAASIIGLQAAATAPRRWFRPRAAAGWPETQQHGERLDRASDVRNQPLGRGHDPLTSELFMAVSSRRRYFATRGTGPPRFVVKVLHAPVSMTVKS